ncbi:hypothetical protein A0J61_06881 [Choanephora cucurbitarum]|uniref:CUE domain-containing protein n=1 Tax=Choanephora cucurbitarum TaxID=101091 RepID=A0A1C7N8Z3_9FUNG|nr:hypothetical protein A0J61_06881 [Choanephora cucurbitarum]
MQKKGKPEPLLGGYMPPARTPEITRSNNSSSYLDQSPSNGSSSGLSGSISMFLKKAMSGSGNLQQQNPVKGKTLPTSNVFAKTQHYVSTPRISTGGSGVFGRSISRLNMNPTRSAQLPRYAQPLKPYNRLAPILNNRVGTAQTKKQQHKPSVTLTPIITSRSNKSAPMPSLTPRSSASSPHPFFSTEYNRFSSFSNDRHSMRQNYAEGIDYLTNVLPQIDIRILQKALEEANGDSMLAISIAVSLSKQLNEPMISNRSTKFKI